MPWLGEVKLMALATALERESARSREARTSDEWRAWAGGVWDGEGSAYLLDHRTHEGYKIAELAITQGGVGIAPELLRRFATVVRRGHVNGPYRQDDSNLDVFRWKTSARADVLATIDELWPWISNVKRRQADAVRAVLVSQEPLSRGRPEWGSYKSHCIHGHEYATARMRPYVSRGVGTKRRDSEQCLQCARDQARARREQEKGSAADDDRRSISEHETPYLLK
jgi:hypothetical protein